MTVNKYRQLKDNTTLVFLIELIKQLQTNSFNVFVLYRPQTRLGDLDLIRNYINLFDLKMSTNLFQ
jgi:hypothetical protein